MKILTCPQCGGTLNLTQYPGVYHCRYCRTLVESDVQALREIELRERELALREQSLIDTRAFQLKKEQKVEKWQKLCHFWWGFIGLTMILGIFAAFSPVSFSKTLGMIVFICLKIRIFGTPVVTALRPDDCYPVYSPPACSQGVLLFAFWIADMFEWVFAVLAMI